MRVKIIKSQNTSALEEHVNTFISKLRNQTDVKVQYQAYAGWQCVLISYWE